MDVAGLRVHIRASVLLLFPSTVLSVTVINAHGRTRLRRDSIRDSAERVLRSYRRRTASISIILVDDEELLRINREFLEHDYYTDVITFPLEENPLEGEIYISVDRARVQAKEYGVTLYNEVCRLAIHGTLHLLGHDDHTEEERLEMRRLEDRFLQHDGERKARKKITGVDKISS